MRREVFIKKFKKAVQEGNAAVFAGAGTSVDAGFVNWKELVRSFSEEIELDVDKETDLIGITQYYINSKSGNRGSLNQEIVDQLSSQEAETEVMNLLTRLPISTYWTTNYDDSHDSYISLVSLEEFKQDHTKYIDNAKDKRDRLHEFNI